jgi:hypothetical protein
MKLRGQTTVVVASWHPGGFDSFFRVLPVTVVSCIQRERLDNRLDFGNGGSSSMTGCPQRQQGLETRRPGTFFFALYIYFTN